MKKLFSAVAVILFVLSVNAQTKVPVKFSIGGEASLPIGKFNDAGYNFGVGGSVQIELKSLQKFGFIANSGILNYSQKSGLGGGSFSFVPIMIGAKYYTYRGAYVQFALGAAIRTNYNSGTNFIYSPGVGFMLDHRLDLLFKFSGLGNVNYNSLGLRLAYNFGK